MKLFIRGIVIIAGILLIFILITACAPNKALTKDRLFGTKEKAVHTSDEAYEFNYEDGNESADNDAEIKSPAQKKKKAVKNDPLTAEDEMNTAEGPKREKYYQTGIASWYGREFHGKMTASGERFDMKELTAAHKSLPFGSIITVKNLDNGREVRVRINDRGPYKKGRILDLSYGAAKKIELLSDGEAMVGINLVRKSKGRNLAGSALHDEEIEPVSGILPAERETDENDVEDAGRVVDSGAYAIQAGAFYSRKNAQQLKSRIEECVDGTVIVVRENDLYKVRVEGIRSRKEADRYKKKLRNNEINSYVVETRE